MHDKKKELEEADSFIICSAEYNSALPPALTNMLDHYPPAAYKDRPVGKSSVITVMVPCIKLADILTGYTFKIFVSNIRFRPSTSLTWRASW